MAATLDSGRRAFVAAGLAAPVAFATGGMAHAATDAAAPMRYADFQATIGVNTHLRYTNSQYNDVAAVLAAMKYCGVRYARDTAINSAAPNSAHYGVLADAGVRFCLFWGIGRTMRDAIEQVSALEAAHPGAVEWLEGPNEIQPGLAYGGRTGLPAAQQFMRDMRAAAAADPRLRHTPIVSFTSFAPAASVADFGNHHPYPKAGAQPGDLIRARRDEWVGPGGAMPGKPMVFTEFGYHTLVGKPAHAGHWQGVDEETQAILIVNGCLDAAAAGVARTYIYQLFDGAADRNGVPNQENHFGLFRLDGSPKPAATALKALFGLTADHNPRARTFAPSPATARVTAERRVNVLGLQSAAGETLLLLWSETPVWDPLASAPRPAAPCKVTISLPREARIAAWDLVNFYPLTDGIPRREAVVTLSSRPVAVRIG